MKNIVWLVSLVVFIVLMNALLFDVVHQEKFNEAYSSLRNAFSLRPSQSLLNAPSITPEFRLWLQTGRIKTFVPRRRTIETGPNTAEICYIQNDTRAGAQDPLFATQMCNAEHPIFKGNQLIGTVAQVNIQSQGESIPSGKCVFTIRRDGITENNLKMFANAIASFDPAGQIYRPVAQPVVQQAVVRDITPPVVPPVVVPPVAVPPPPTTVVAAPPPPPPRPMTRPDPSKQYHVIGSHAMLPEFKLGWLRIYDVMSNHTGVKTTYLVHSRYKSGSDRTCPRENTIRGWNFEHPSCFKEVNTSAHTFGFEEVGQKLYQIYTDVTDNGRMYVGSTGGGITQLSEKKNAFTFILEEADSQQVYLRVIRDRWPASRDFNGYVGIVKENQRNDNFAITLCGADNQAIIPNYKVEDCRAKFTLREA